MSFLFDITDDDEKPTPKAKKKPVDELPEDPVSMETSKITDPFAGLGVSDGEFECGRCGAGFFDVMAEDRGGWLLSCGFCGFRQWEDAPHRDEFFFKKGRYPGMTVAQVAAQAGGDAYIRFMAKKADSKRVRDACQSWLDRPAGPA